MNPAALYSCPMWNSLSSLAHVLPPLRNISSSPQPAQRTQTPTDLSALWSGATQMYCWCPSQNNVGASSSTSDK
jgi:hypothetical protein